MKEMVKCAKCGNKIGFFESRYDYDDAKGNPVMYCSKCDNRYAKVQLKMTEYEIEMLKAQRKVNLRLAWIIFLLILVICAIGGLR
jgi:hypothetical protein